jgi:hypothetical protein
VEQGPANRYTALRESQPRFLNRNVEHCLGVEYAAIRNAGCRMLRHLSAPL